MSKAPSMRPDRWAGPQEGDSLGAVHPADLRNRYKLFHDDQDCNLAAPCVVR